jgi:hypothetical protein
VSDVSLIGVRPIGVFAMMQAACVAEIVVDVLLGGMMGQESWTDVLGTEQHHWAVVLKKLGWR